MNRSHRTISEILSPALAAVALSVLIAGCTTSSTTDEGMTSSSSNETMTQSSSSKTALPSTSSTDTTTASSSDAMPVSSKPVMNDDSAYNDGTYAADGFYRSPAGAEEIHVSLTLNDDIVTAVNVEGTATNPKSKMMQGQFIAGINAQVVGKPIDSLSLGVVNGSSLTPKGFMDAVAKIKTEASAS